MSEPGTPAGKHLEWQFTLELQFQWEMAPLGSRTSGEGEYIGSGIGSIQGERLNGKVRWDLFEKQEEKLCRSSLSGTIDSEDGAQINFDSRGFFIQPEESNPNNWLSTASVRFFTSDPRYLWLNTQLAMWEGQFDMATFHHHYLVYFPAVE